MEYNTDRPKLIIPEYGRNIHRMIYHALDIQDRKKRNEYALGIIKVMGNLNPHLRDVPDFQHKLWDQLFIMSEFKLDVDSPYPKPSPEEFQVPPKRVAYGTSLNQYRYYGKIIRDIIKVAIDIEDEDKREGLYYVIANTMKKNYLKWNKDTIEDETIFNDLLALSNGKIDLSKNKEPLLCIDDILNPLKKRKGGHFSHWPSSNHSNGSNHNNNNGKWR